MSTQSRPYHPTPIKVLILVVWIPLAALLPLPGADAAENLQRATAEHLVTGQDRNQRPSYDYRKIVLTSPHVAEPVQFRYAWGRNPMGNVIPRFSKSHAPLATQRSDDWKIHEVPVKFGDQPNRQTQNLAIQAHRLFDQQRRLKNAQQLLDERQEENRKMLEEWEAKWSGQQEKME